MPARWFARIPALGIENTDGISRDNCMSQSWLDLKLSSKKVVEPVLPRFVNYFGRGSPQSAGQIYRCNWQRVNRSCRSDSNLVPSRHWTRIDKSSPVFEATVYITSGRIRVKLSRNIEEKLWTRRNRKYLRLTIKNFKCEKRNLF